MTNSWNFVPVGDMHVKKEDIPEATRFIRWLADGIKILNKNMNTQAIVVFMGDQYNDFGVVKVEVEEFWKWAYAHLRTEIGYGTVSLTGNHDMNQDESASAMSVHDGMTTVVGKQPIFLSPSVAAIGFIRKEDAFYSAVMSAYNTGARHILCHAEFQGCQYENGFYAPHGFDLSKYPADLKFYSGHIHMKQTFGNVTYFGTPRHLTRSDIGEVKGIHIVDFDKNEQIFQATPSEVCSPFMELTVTEGDVDTPAILQQIAFFSKELSSPSKLYVEIKGAKEFVKKTGDHLPPGLKLRSTYTDEVREVKMRESEGIPATFGRFAQDFFVNNPLSADVQKEVMDKVYKACPSLKNGVT